MADPNLAEEHFKDFDGKSGVVDIEMLLNSVAWRDFDKIAKNRIDLICKEALLANSMEELRELRGEAKGLAFFRDFPHIMVERIKLVEEAEAKQRNE